MSENAVGGPTDPRWTRLRGEVSRCERCPLHRSRTRTVFYRGGTRPRVVFVGEAPGAEEDRLGLPFVGRSGKRLDEAISTLPLGPDEFGILNVVKCRPPKNRFVRSAAESCRPYLDRQLALLRPEFLVTLGAHALRAFASKETRVTDVAGAPLSVGPYWLFPLLHPAAMLHAPALRARWRADVAALGSFLAAGGPQRF